jgi:hypothetical protein
LTRRWSEPDSNSRSHLDEKPFRGRWSGFASLRDPQVALDGNFHTRECGAVPWAKLWKAGGTSVCRAGRRQRRALIDRAARLRPNDPKVAMTYWVSYWWAR